MVDLRPFFQAWQELRAESDKLDGYASSATFWAVYDAKLRASATLVGPTLEDMRTNSGWGSPGDPNGASAAFYARVGAGLESIRAWLEGTPAVRDAFTTLSTNVGNHFHTVDMHRAWLLNQNKVTGGAVAKITEQDGEVTVPPDIAAEVDRRVAESLRLHTELKNQFADAVRALNALKAQAWLGPSAPPAPAAGTTPGGPGAGPGGAPGGAPGAGRAGAGGNTDPTTPGSEDMPAGPAGSDPAVGSGAGSGPGSSAGLPTDPLATSDSLADTPSATADAGEVPSVPSSPELAGTPTPTRTPPAGSPDVPPSPGGVPPAGVSTVDRSLPVPLPPTPRGPAGSTLDRAGTRVVAEPAPAPPRTGGGVTGSTTGTTSAFYPPMYPPMGTGGNRAGAVPPGEAEFTGGLTRRARGAEVWRAGLQPHLLGRGGDHDEEPAVPPPPDGDVLDDELWQVP